jgi:hypothetical protein
MPDVTVTAALVEGGEEPLHVWRAPGGDASHGRSSRRASM